MNLVDFRYETEDTVYINPEHVAMVVKTAAGDSAADDSATDIVLAGMDGTLGRVRVQEDVWGVVAKLMRGKTSGRRTRHDETGEIRA